MTTMSMTTVSGNQGLLFFISSLPISFYMRGGIKRCVVFFEIGNTSRFSQRHNLPVGLRLGLGTSLLSPALVASLDRS